MEKIYIALRDFKRYNYCTDNSSYEIQIKKGDEFVEDSYNGFRCNYNYRILDKKNNRTFNGLGRLEKWIDYEELEG